ncbi:MAG: phosphate acyltransferase PlsX [Acidobacteria bacterium]|nr:MAG: phosphate acyltransferase PlsX [Acidobacteriota bacterium]
MDNPIVVAVDAMGGDFAPRSAVTGAWNAVNAGARAILVGDRDRIRAELRRLAPEDAVAELGDRLAIEHAEEVVAMEEPPAMVAKKRRSSLRICARLVREGRAQALVTAGNTGAAMIAAKTVIGAIPGVDRPALAGVFPTRQGRTVVLDVGANLNAKVRHLRQFAVMGHFYAQEIIGTPAPRIGLMSVGEEESKGTDLLREVYRVLQTTGLNFVGNVEGRDLFRGTVDVIVCDGFVGNVMLKSSESLVLFVERLLQHELRRGLRTRLGAWLARPAFERFRQRLDWSEYGAAPLLGVRGGCFIGHGRSGAKAVRNAIRGAMEFCAAQLHVKIERKVAELHAQEERLLGSRSTP